MHRNHRSESNRSAAGGGLKPLFACCIHAAAIAALATISSLTALEGEFVYDDERSIVRNSLVYGGFDWSDLVHHDFWGQALDHPASHLSMRPLTTLSFRMDARRTQERLEVKSLSADSGLQPKSFKRSNVVLHGTAGIMLYITLSVVLRSRQIAFLSALLFSSQAIHTEVVANITGRAEILSCIFVLSSVLCASTARTSYARSSLRSYFLTVLVGVFSILALCSKENGICALPICIALDVLAHYVHGENVAGATLASIRRCAIWSTFLVGMVVARMFVMDFRMPTYNPGQNPVSFSAITTA
eukprot:scaffold1167_cov418-Prasinococcus_capsulatus_cf.AAC.8